MSKTSDIDRSIFRIALPAIVSNLTVPLLGLCDTGVTGHLGSARYVAAIAVGSMMLNLLYWSFGFLRMGTTGMTAQAFGSKNAHGTHIVFTRALMLAIVASLLLILFQKPISTILMMIIGGDASTASLAKEYFRLCIWSAPGMLGTVAITGWFIGMQDSKRPMIIAISTNIVNIAASIILVFPCGLGFIGTAVGTLIANWVSLLLALVLVRRFCGGRLPFARLREAMDATGLRRFFKVNGEIFVRSAFIMSVSLAVTSIGARQGELTLAANAVAMQFFFLFSYFMDGMAFSAEALGGKSVGAHDSVGLKQVVGRLLLWCGVLAVVFTMAYGFGYRVFAEILVPEPDLISKVDTLRLWITLIPCVSFAAFLFDGLYIGMTATRAMMVATAIATCLFFGISLLLPLFLELDANVCMWLAFLVYLAVRGLLLAARYPREARVRTAYTS